MSENSAKAPVRTASQSSPEDLDFGRTVKARREELGWTQADLISRLEERGLAHFQRQMLRRVEAGERPLRLGEAARFAAVLGLSLDDLLEDLETDPDYQLQVLQNAVITSQGSAVDHSVTLLDAQRRYRKARAKARESGTDTVAYLGPVLVAAEATSTWLQAAHPELTDTMFPTNRERAFEALANAAREALTWETPPWWLDQCLGLTAVSEHLERPNKDDS